MTMMKRTLLDIEGEYTIRVMDMPYGSKGAVVYDDEGFANVYINARSGSNQQKKAIKHELDHIEHDDAYSDEDLCAIEARAHRAAGEPPPRFADTIPGLMRASDLLPTAHPPVPVPSPSVSESPFCWNNRFAEIEDELSLMEDAYLEPDY